MPSLACVGGSRGDRLGAGAPRGVIAVRGAKEVELVMGCWENSTGELWGQGDREHAPFQADSSQRPVSAQLLPGHLPATSHPTQPTTIPGRSHFQVSCSSSLTFTTVFFCSNCADFPYDTLQVPQDRSQSCLLSSAMFITTETLRNTMVFSSRVHFPSCPRAQQVLCKALGCQWFFD